MQALKSKAFNNFAAIYFLLLERLQKYTRLFSVQPEPRLSEDHRRPSTVAEQAVVRFAVGSHPPALGDRVSLVDTRAGIFSRTTDGVTPVDLTGPHRATQQQRIYTTGPPAASVYCGAVTSGPRLALAKMSIDEGVELEGSENSYEMVNPPSAPTPASAAKPTLVSLSSSGGSSDAASFDSATDSEMLANAVQLTPWVFTSGESLSSATGPECPLASATSQDVPSDRSASPAESSFGTGVSEYQPTGRCYLAVPGPANTLQVPDVGTEGGRQDGFFHSGRRASDGLATRGDILQLQQLMKTRGVPELQKELELLPILTNTVQPAEPRSQRLELRSGRPMHQRSFEEGSCGATAGRLSPLSARRSRQAVSGNYVRPRLAPVNRGRHQASTKSPLAELTTLCRMLPAGGISERNRSPVRSEHQMLQQQFQQLGINGVPGSLTAAAPLLPTTSGVTHLPVCVGEIGACLSEHRLAVAAPSTTHSDTSSRRSQDSIHSSTTKESIAPIHLPIGQPVSIVDESRRHIVRRTLFRLAQQQTLMSSFGEEDIPEVSPVLEQSPGPNDGGRPESKPANSMDVT